jgi:autotransporter-associated beta strand protein
MKSNRTSSSQCRVHARLVASLAIALAAASSSAQAQTSYTSTSNATAWNAARWNNSSNAAPYGSTYTANNNVLFTSGNYTFAGMGTAVNVGNVTLSDNVNVKFSTGGTFATNGANRTITLASGSTLDLNATQISTTAGTGFIISGSGVFATGTYSTTTNAQSFTINSGTVIARGTTGLGNGANSVLSLNGGTVASNASRDFANTRFGGGIVVGGNVQFGERSTVVSLADSAANLSFANNVSLGNFRRTFTLGNNGTQTFSGVISGTNSANLTFAANSGTSAGRFDITGTANTFSGGITITGGEARFTADGSLGTANKTITIDGGRFASASSANMTIASTRDIAVGDTVGTSISATGTSSTITYNGTIADVSGKTGAWAKQGSGTLALGGVSTYTGATAITGGTLRLTTGNNRLPTGTVVSLGDASSTSLGTLDLNGLNQQIAGLASNAGSATTGNNTVTSATAATLTISGNDSYAYGNGSAANSGLITGAITLVKSGSGTQTLGGNNTYSGGTTLSEGTLLVTNTSGSGTGSGNVTVNAGILGGSGSISGNVSLNGATIGSSNATLTLSSNLTTTGASNVAASSTVNVTGTTTVSSGNLTINGNLGVSGSIAGAGSVIISSTGRLTGNSTIASAAKLSGGSFGTSGNTLNLGSTLDVSGTNTIATGVTVNVTGNTTITSGVFSVNGNLGGDGAKIIGNTATLKGNGTISGPTTIQAGGTLAPGNSPGVQTFTGDLTLAGTTELEINGSDRGDTYDGINLTGTSANTLTYGGTLSMSFNAPITIGVYDLFAIGSVTQASAFGTVTIGGTAIDSSTGAITDNGWTASITEIASGPTWNLIFNNATGDLTITAIPEPSAYGALAGFGMIGVALYRRRSQNAAKRAA